MSTPDDRVEVAHVSGFAALRAAAEGRVVARRGEAGWCEAEAAGAEGDPFGATVSEEAPVPQKTCAVCAAANDADRDTCWNCGASLRRRR